MRKNYPFISHTQRTNNSLDRDTSGLLEMDRANLKQAASRYAIPELNLKPGHVVDKIKDELHKTVEAKRRLLERNFINFRFDEYKNP